MARTLHNTFATEPLETSLAFHVRRWRKWYGDSGLSQQELAAISGVSVAYLRKCEYASRIQPSLESFVRVALALGKPIEKLVSPQTLHHLEKEVEANRERLLKAARRHPESR